MPQERVLIIHAAPICSGVIMETNKTRENDSFYICLDISEVNSHNNIVILIVYTVKNFYLFSITSYGL